MLEIGLLTATCAAMAGAELTQVLWGPAARGSRRDTAMSSIVTPLQIVTIAWLLWQGRWDLLGILLAVVWLFILRYCKDTTARINWTGLCALIALGGWILQAL